MNPLNMPQKKPTHTRTPDSKPTLLVLRGLPASGKSTYAMQWLAEAPSRARVNRDDIRFATYGPDYVQYSDSEDQDDKDARNHCENTVTKIEQTQVRALLEAGFDVVVDACHLRPHYVRDWVEIADEIGATVTTREFPIPVINAIVRDAERGKRGERSVGEDDIRRMTKYLGKHGTLLPVDLNSPVEKGEDKGGPVISTYVAKPGTPLAIIVDIDGTIALNKDVRNPMDFSRVALDNPNRNVIAAVTAMWAQGYQVVYCSGRPDSCREDTEKWIAEHVGIAGPLFMRKTGDVRNDAIVKQELFDANIRGNWDVRMAWDDRPRVIRYWAAIGLSVVDVDPTSGEF
jgi:predicted kinase